MNLKVADPKRDCGPHVQSIKSLTMVECRTPTSLHQILLPICLRKTDEPAGFMRSKEGVSRQSHHTPDSMMWWVSASPLRSLLQMLPLMSSNKHDDIHATDSKLFLVKSDALGGSVPDTYPHLYTTKHVGGIP